VQSESVLLEIVDDAGRACAPGRAGRVVVTSLHNFATPLIRYELGDLAEFGAPCACGRSLPVISRVLGRSRSTPSSSEFGDRNSVSGNSVTVHLIDVIRQSERGS
jgi:phenylacetate-coenzyme A ligase PaaK-like adenylate-forming protein